MDEEKRNKNEKSTLSFGALRHHHPSTWKIINSTLILIIFGAVHTCCCINKRYEKSLLAYSSKNFIIIFYFILFPQRNPPENLLSFICSYNNISSVNIRMTWIKERDPSLYFWIIPPSSSSSSLLKLYIFLYRIVHALAEINEYEQINEIKY